MGSGADPVYDVGGTEGVYPGDVDIVHGQYMYHPDSNDIDLYKFEVQSDGLFNAETIAERMTNSSLLDTVLTLYQEVEVKDAQGNVIGVDRKIIARNDDYYSEDSYVEMRSAGRNLLPGREQHRQHGFRSGHRGQRARGDLARGLRPPREFQAGNRRVR